MWIIMTKGMLVHTFTCVVLNNQIKINKAIYVMLLQTITLPTFLWGMPWWGMSPWENICFLTKILLKYIIPIKNYQITFPSHSSTLFLSLFSHDWILSMKCLPPSLLDPIVFLSGMELSHLLYILCFPCIPHFKHWFPWSAALVPFFKNMVYHCVI